MRLTAADIGALPLPVALFDCDGTLLASSPEWRGGGPGTVVYRLPVTSLAVASEQQDRDVADLLVELVAALHSAAGSVTGDEQLRLAALASGVALVAGMPRLQPGTTDEVLDILAAVLATVSNNPVRVTQHTPGPVPDAGVMALALRQLVVNARRHDDAAEVRVYIGAGPTFTLRWRGQPQPGGVTTSRHQARRDRWGLGFVRQAMDALGGIYLAPRKVDDELSAVIALDPAPRLLLPLAAARAGVIVQASEAWDEETHVPPGRRVPEQWSRVVAAAERAPGTIARDGPLRARCVRDSTWLAVPPEGGLDRARDVLRGLEHERDLIDSTQHGFVSVLGLAQVISLLLGDPPRAVFPESFNRDYPRLATLVGAPPLAEPFDGPRAPQPELVAYLATRLHGVLNVRGGRLRIQVPDSMRRGDALGRRLANAQGGISLP